MRILALLLLLCAPVFAADAGPDEETKVKIVKYMLKTPMDQADPTLVSGFMKINTDSLPAALRDKARGKQMEIDAIVKIHNGKKKGPFRFPAECEVKRYEDEKGIRIMGMIMGNTEILSEEEAYIEQRADCTEEQLICEFSLNVVLMKRKGKPPLKRYFLMENDPVYAFIAEFRAHGKTGVTNYFGELKPTCQKQAGAK